MQALCNLLGRFCAGFKTKLNVEKQYGLSTICRNVLKNFWKTSTAIQNLCDICANLLQYITLS